MLCWSFSSFSMCQHTKSSVYIISVVTLLFQQLIHVMLHSGTTCSMTCFISKLPKHTQQMVWQLAVEILKFSPKYNHNLAPDHTATMFVQWLVPYILDN
jgi:hypothetical protein